MAKRNTLINYMYRDSGNNKYRGDFVVKGRVTMDDLRPFRYEHLWQMEDHEIHFAPLAVGLPHLLNDQWDSTLDHDLHELEEFEATEDSRVVCSAKQLIERFKLAFHNGWLEYRPK